jgi:signal transduction histidine kinase
MSRRVAARGLPRWWKLTPVVAIVTVVTLLTAGVLMARYVDEANARQEMEEDRVQAHVLASTVTAALTFDDRVAAQEYVNAIKANSQVEAAAVYDSAGHLFAAYRAAPDVTLPAAATPQPPRFTGDRLVVAVPVHQDGIPLGTVYLRSQVEPYAERLQRYGVIGLLTTMASIVIAVLGMMHLVQRRSNEQLARHAEQLANANQALESQIEQRELAEEALRQSQKMEAIGQLTGGVAHDFNNLLQVILGNLERLGRRLSTPGKEGAVLLESAIRAAGRAATLTQRLLAFARRQPLAPMTLDLNQLVTGMMELFQRSLGEQISVDTVLAAGLWRVFVDENQLENALVNLAVNARDAMPQGGRLIVETRNARLDEAYVRAWQDVRPGDYVLVTVTDTGMGMSKEIMARAFDPFFTTKDVGQGTGLGLSQVYGFVHQSGGHVEIDSTPGEGTSIRLYLPRFFELESAVTGGPAPQQLPLGNQHESILVVEDEADVRGFTRDTLHELGYDVREAPDGSAALVVLDHEPNLRLIFTDIGLPGRLNGRQLAEEARRRRPGLKVLLTTGYTRDTLAREGRLEPGMALLVKPFTEADLARKIREMLDG